MFAHEESGERGNKGSITSTGGQKSPEDIKETSQGTNTSKVNDLQEAVKQDPLRSSDRPSDITINIPCPDCVW